MIKSLQTKVRRWQDRAKTEAEKREKLRKRMRETDKSLFSGKNRTYAKLRKEIIFPSFVGEDTGQMKGSLLKMVTQREFCFNSNLILIFFWLFENIKLNGQNKA